MGVWMDWGREARAACSIASAKRRLAADWEDEKASKWVDGGSSFGMLDVSGELGKDPLACQLVGAPRPVLEDSGRVGELKILAAGSTSK